MAQKINYNLVGMVNWALKFGLYPKKWVIEWVNEFYEMYHLYFYKNGYFDYDDFFNYFKWHENSIYNHKPDYLRWEPEDYFGWKNAKD